MIRPSLLDRIAALAAACDRARKPTSNRILCAAAQLIRARWATAVAREWLAKQILLQFNRATGHPLDPRVRELLQESLERLASMPAPISRGECEFCPANGGGCIVCGY